MVNFNVRKTEKPTAFLLLSEDTPYFERALKEQGIEDIHMEPLEDVKHLLPHGTTIPDAVNTAEIDVCFSNYNTNDLEKFLIDVLRDPETKTYQQTKKSYAQKMQRWREAFKKDPSPFGRVFELPETDEMRYNLQGIEGVRKCDLLLSEKFSH